MGKIYEKIVLYLCVSVFLFVLISVSGADAASLYLSPSTGNFIAGGNFTVGVYVSSGDQAMNAASATLDFPADKLSVVSMTKDASVVDLWVREPSFSNNSGLVQLEGIVLNPGFQGEAGKLLSVTFKAKSPGQSPVTFKNGSVLANDGAGTNILNSMSGGNYTIQVKSEIPEALPPTSKNTPGMPKISSPTHPDSEKWYSNDDLAIKWELSDYITGVSRRFDQKPIANPGPISDGLMIQEKYNDIEDGEWYFHIKFRNEFGWGAINHRKVLVDVTPPKSFDIEIIQEDLTDPRPLVNFQTSDNTSGVDYYEVMVDNSESISVSGEEAESGFKLPVQLPGGHKVTVKAFDKAGNFSQSERSFKVASIEAPKITDFPSALQEGDSLFVRGRGLTESKILIFIKKEGEDLAKGEIISDKAGNWYYIYDKTVKRGIYQIWAQQIDERGAISNPSNKYNIAVELPSLLKFGTLAFDYLSVLITFIVIVIGIGILIFYTWHRIHLWRSRVRKEITEAEKSTKAAFDALREDINDKLKKLEKVSTERKFTKGEKKIIKDLKRAIKTVEAYIKEEIQDVKDELD